ncbi:MAG: pilus assembly protein TadG-related protein [Alphaproteobacteria bacterium]
MKNWRLRAKGDCSGGTVERAQRVAQEVRVKATALRLLACCTTVAWRLRALSPAIGSFLGDRRGALAIYVAFITTALIGASTIVFDVGRLGIVRTQVQNAADAAAMAAAVQLDSQTGARARADAVARGAADQRSGFRTTSGSSNIQIDTVTFSQSTTANVVATTDQNALSVTVTIEPRPVKLFLARVLAMLTGSTNPGFTNITADATATWSPIVCDPPPLMVCNTDEQGLQDLTEAAAAGKQILIRMGGNNPAPGNFGLMCPPSNPNCGANTVRDFLAAEQTNECATTTMSTKPGVNFNMVNTGVNSRFDIGSLANPARDIMTYPRDSVFQANVLGNGSWSPSDYWTAEHGGALPAGIVTRYQAYLYEMGEGFASDGADTVYPLPADTSGLASQGYTVVSPPGEDIPAAGVPTSTPSTDLTRRVMKAAVVQCQLLGVSGRTDIDMRDMAILELFITEPITGNGNNAPIVGEIVRKLTSANSSDISTNVRLLD